MGISNTQRIECCRTTLSGDQEGNINERSITMEKKNNSDLGASMKSETSNEYVLNVAFYSFLAFMSLQALFAIVARSESMLADSMAMSVDAFTYLFNLAAEKVKHRSNRKDDTAEHISIEERRRRKKMMRLYLEIIPPSISVTALICVSIQTLLEAIATIKNPSSSSSANVDEPNVKLMLTFSALNLALDMLNVSCFSKVTNFSITGDMTVNEEPEPRYVVLVEENRISPSKKTKEFPPSIIVDTSLDSSYESSNINECEALLGIPVPNYGLPKTDNEWGESFSLGAVCGDVESDGITSEGISLANSIETGDSGSGSALSNSKSIRKAGAISLDIGPDELCDISEGDENTESDELSIGEETSRDNDSERSGRGFNLNMCSAYTHVMADTLRSVAVLVAAALSCSIETISPSEADAVASIVVSVIIAASLGPLIVGLLKTVSELKALKGINNAPMPWMSEFQHLPSMSPRITRRRE